jgi:Tfp pilus assembly protein PilN
MRPVNLIPKEERPGGRRPMRGGPMAYIVVGALVAALLGVTALVVTDNQISDRKAEVANLEGEVAAAEAKARTLSAYTQFHSVREQRVATITSLADSRFDWERVMRELALILPGNVWLTNLSASASPSSEASGGSGGSLRAAVAGPALTLGGCARGQDAVAGFVQALKDIDGVTRVGVESSSLAGASTGAATDSAGSEGCPAGSSIAQFQMVVAFDAAPVASGSGSAEAPAQPAEQAQQASASTEGEG